MFIGSTLQAINFRHNIRNYNSAFAFAFASFGAKIALPPSRGTYCLHIHSQTYHCSNTLHPNEGEDRQYGQLYIIEGDQAVSTHMKNYEFNTK